MGLHLINCVCISHRSKIGLFIYGPGKVLYTKVDSQSQGIDLHYIVSKELNIRLGVGILIHKGKVVDPVSTLAHQGFLNGSNVIFMIRAKGGGKNDGSEVCYKGEY